MDTCRVLVVSPSPLLGQALAQLLSRLGAFEADWEPLDALERRASTDWVPALVLVESDGTDLPVDLGPRIRQCWPHAAMVLVLRTEGTAEQRKALPGSVGCLSTSVDERELVRSLQRIHEHGRLHPRHAPFRRGAQVTDPERLAVATLTDRETEVLGLLVAGLPAADMAEKLGLSLNTLRAHVQNLLAKLGVHSRLEAVAVARRIGMVGSFPARAAARRPSPGEPQEPSPRPVPGSALPAPRVLLADDRPLVRAALRAGLEAEHGVVIVAEASSTAEAAFEARRFRPDVTVLDWHLPPDGGVAGCAMLKSGDVPTKVLVVSQAADEDSLLATIEAGADGYADWSGGLAGLAMDVRRLHAGEACIPPGMLAVLLRRLIQRGREADEAVDRFSRLSRREREILALMVEGLDNQAIARALVISPHTARTHVQNVLSKLDVHSRVEAAAVAMEYGLIERFMGAS